jgi:hypothetical protein
MIGPTIHLHAEATNLNKDCQLNPESSRRQSKLDQESRTRHKYQGYVESSMFKRYGSLGRMQNLRTQILNIKLLTKETI